MQPHMFDAFGYLSVASLADGSGRHRDCFADEVVVDFPSVAGAVERIRQGFLAAERGEPLAAAVSISPREARQGVLVPLEVPVRSTCDACSGRGETWSGPCLPCDGSGARVHKRHVRVSVPPGVVDGSRLRFTVSPRHSPSTDIELRVLVA